MFDTDEGDMKSPFKQFDIELRLVAEEPGAPDPGSAGCRILGNNDAAAEFTKWEVVAVEAEEG